MSIVVVTRDGLEHLRRLFDGLARNTRYRNFEVVVVDNASTDGTIEWLQRDRPFPLHVIRNDENRSFSEANNQGLAVAAGELVLALNNDVEPIRSDWLSRLVAALRRGSGVVATGALLVYPEREAPEGRSFPFADLTVQHAGVAFELHDGTVRGRNRGAGCDPLEESLRETREVAALTAACLLTRTETMRDLGGFDTAYWYGSEDWDLSLRLAARGRLLLVGEAMLYHYEYGTQSSTEPEARAEYRRRNHVAFNSAWGADVRRGLLVAQLGGGGVLSGGNAPTFVLDPAGSEVLQWLGSELRAVGWVDHADRTGQPLLELAETSTASTAATADEPTMPAGLTIAVAHAGSSGEPPSHAALVVALDGRPRTPLTHASESIHLQREGTSNDRGSPDAVSVVAPLIDSIRAFVTRPRFAIRNCATNRERSARWGDTHFATGFAAGLARRGFEAQVHTFDEWEQPRAHPYDVVVHLRGLHRYRPRRGPVNVLWIISHADEVTDDELDDFDHILVASATFAAKIQQRTSKPVDVFHQATDPMLFHPVGRDLRQAASGIVVVANARWPYRPGPRWLMELGVDFSLYGANWDTYPERRFVKSGYVSNAELSDIYATADVVVADQWDHMSREGFVANRLFDIAAAGGFAVSTGGPGITEVFGDLVPTYNSRAELSDVLGRYLDDVCERSRLSHAAMTLVRREHTFDVRVDKLLRLLDV